MSDDPLIVISISRPGPCRRWTLDGRKVDDSVEAAQQWMKQKRIERQRAPRSAEWQKQHAKAYGFHPRLKPPGYHQKKRQQAWLRERAWRKKTWDTAIWNAEYFGRTGPE